MNGDGDEENIGDGACFTVWDNLCNFSIDLTLECVNFDRITVHWAKSATCFDRNLRLTFF